MDVTITLTGEQIDEIVRSDLQAQLDSYRRDLKRAKKGPLVGVYSWNEDEEIRELKKTIKALKRIIKFY